jgi:hypothetical protein
MTKGEYFIQYYLLERYFSILSKSEGRGYQGAGSSSSRGGNSSSSSSSEVVARIISILVTVGRGGDYLDTSSDSSSRDYSREISCSESVLWTTNCPLVLA